MQPFNGASVPWRKGYAILAVLRLQPLYPLPVVNLEETLRKQDDRPQLAKIY